MNKLIPVSKKYSKKATSHDTDLNNYMLEKNFWIGVVLKRTIELILFVIVSGLLIHYVLKGAGYANNNVPEMFRPTINMLTMLFHIGVYYVNFNVVAGLYELLQRQAITHDFIECDLLFCQKIKGHIIKIGLFSVKIRNLDNEYINIPNIKYVISTIKRLPRKS